MRELVAGHTPELQGNKGSAPSPVQFYMDPALHDGRTQGGTTNQEVCRALIARLKSLDDELPWGGAQTMIGHLREVILLHEVRAAMRRGICGFAAWDWLSVRPALEELPPRKDGHVSAQNLHAAASCAGRCG